MSEFLAAIPFSLLLVVSTGPVFFVIIETSISKGARHAFCVDIGAVIADIVFILIALFGANTIHQNLETNPSWFLLGGVVLIGFGLISYIRTRRNKNHVVFATEQLQKGNYLFYIGKGFLLNIINMGTLLFWLGLVVLFGTKYQMDYGKILPFFSYILVVYLSFDLIKIYLAKQLKTKLTPQVIYKLKQFVHVILILFGLFFIFQGTFPDEKQKLEATLQERLK
ncbi:MAG: LysE family transporter [Bacteroidetes bacterium]|nr:LysE family transporter [Bacteroidota bacterium]MDA0888879.1 LysE family transporter [Bacteroidota bacterium]MDA1084694.1 LysE family transporter [Bacteroidota bacterium]